MIVHTGYRQDLSTDAIINKTKEFLSLWRLLTDVRTQTSRIIRILSPPPFRTLRVRGKHASYQTKTLATGMSAMS